MPLANTAQVERKNLLLAFLSASTAALSCLENANVEEISPLLDRRQEILDQLTQFPAPLLGAEEEALAMECLTMDETLKQAAAAGRDMALTRLQEVRASRKMHDTYKESGAKGAHLGQLRG